MDDFDIVHLGHEDSQQIIDWAVAAAAMVTLMVATPKHNGTTEALEKLEELMEGIEIMYANIPEPLEGPALVTAQSALDESIRDEEQIEQFKAELEEL